MKRLLIATLIAALGAACSQRPPLEPASATRESAAASAAGAAAKPDVPLNFVAHLDGDEEVPPRDTRGQGQLILQLNPEGTELSYRLIVSNIYNVVASHIHIGAPGVNGSIVAFLFGAVAPGGGRTDGVLATGTITAAALTGPLAGKPLSALIEAMEEGNAYVNAHTNDGVAPTNTGPGDFPGGEIRGQIRRLGS